MMKNTALKVAGAVFLLVAALHALRVFCWTAVLVGGIEIPLVASTVGALVCVALAIWMFLAAKQ